MATAVFVGSYFVRPSRLLAVQAAGAVTWLAYGVMTGQAPIIVSNVVVAGAAGYRLASERLREDRERSGERAMPVTSWPMPR
jgi:hypothetical protein